VKLRRVSCRPTLGRRPISSAIVVVALLAFAAQADERQEAPAIDTGLVESTGIRIMLLDVDATDKKGGPLRGLTAEDFTVLLDGSRREIYSLDNLCRAERRPAKAGKKAAPAIPPGADAEEPFRFILYFDFSQLRQDGRVLALAQARRWVREVMRATDEAQVVAYTFQGGLRELSPPTKDRQELLSVLDRADGDVELVDPFPVGLVDRIGLCCVRCGGYRSPPSCCNHCCPTGQNQCDNYAREEFSRSRASLTALKRFIQRLEEAPGRKALLMFQQNATYQPGRFYSLRVGDHVTLLDEVAAEATLSRTAVYPSFTGDPLASGFSPWLHGEVVNLGANLAAFTGGRHNRDARDLAGLVDTAGREARCLYRIGLVAPEKASGGHVFRVRVRVRGRTLPQEHRVQALDEVDRWWRKARAVLSDPETARDVSVSASIVPLRASG